MTALLHARGTCGPCSAADDGTQCCVALLLVPESACLTEQRWFAVAQAAMVPLEGSRKHYEQACADLMKAQARPVLHLHSCTSICTASSHCHCNLGAATLPIVQLRGKRFKGNVAAGIPAEAEREEGAGGGCCSGWRHR